MFAITLACSFRNPWYGWLCFFFFWQIKILMMKTLWMGTDLPQLTPLHHQRPLQTHVELEWGLLADLGLQLWDPSPQVSWLHGIFVVFMFELVSRIFRPYHFPGTQKQLFPMWDCYLYVCVNASESVQCTWVCKHYSHPSSIHCLCVRLELCHCAVRALGETCQWCIIWNFVFMADTLQLYWCRQITATR